MRLLLTGMSALFFCGCLGRGSTDLLHARIREQQELIAESERRIAQAQAALQQTRREADNLRSELAQRSNGSFVAEHTDALVRVTKLQIHSLLSGGVNKDDTPGDDAFVAQVAPVDDDGEVVKLPGDVELTLIDPALPEEDREVGRWTFNADECRSRWTRGFTGSGFQFTVPMSEIPVHDSLVLHARLTTVDGRSFDASQIVRVTPPKTLTASSKGLVLDNAPRELDDINDPPPPPARVQPDELPKWADPKAAADDLKPGQAPLRDSTNWTENTIPQLR